MEGAARTPTTAPRASVIVPARDAVATLGRTLEALGAQDYDGAYEVIVVDDGSRDGTATIAARSRGVTTVRQPPSGPAQARDHGVKRSTGTVLAFCDADVFPAPGWLAAGVRALETAELVQGKVLPDPEATLGPFDRTIWVTADAGLFETASLFVTRELYDRAGGFEQWLQPRSGKALAEDVWFGYRCKRLGARSAFCEQALAHHAVFARNWREYVAERARLQYFPAMAAKMPELRRAFLYRRVFLNRRSARFDAALLSAAAALVLTSPAPAVGTLPYLYELRRHTRRAPDADARTVAAVDALADLVGLAALLTGSLTYRSPVL